MGTREAFRQRVRREQLRKARLRVATVRLTDAEQERIWAIVAAHEAGLSLRQIAAATGLSRSRIHQLLQDNAARAIPTWLSHLRGRVHDSDSIREALPPGSQAQIQDRVAEEVEVLRWCLDWLERRARGEQVIVDLRPDTEDASAYVQFDHARGRRVLARMVADLDTLTRQAPEAEPTSPEETTDWRT